MNVTPYSKSAYVTTSANVHMCATIRAKIACLLVFAGMLVQYWVYTHIVLTVELLCPCPTRRFVYRGTINFGVGRYVQVVLVYLYVYVVEAKFRIEWRETLSGGFSQANVWHVTHIVAVSRATQLKLYKTRRLRVETMRRRQRRRINNLKPLPVVARWFSNLKRRVVESRIFHRMLERKMKDGLTCLK